MSKQPGAKPKNPLLLKDQDGKVKQTIYDLPPQNHPYGKKVQDDPEPLKHVINGWQTSIDSAENPPSTKNYQQLNRIAVQSGIYTAKQQNQFRKTKDIMVETKKGQKVIPIMLPEENFTYGVPNRPSTPIKLVVGNCYGLEQEQKNTTMYQTQNNKNSSKLAAKKTKSQQLREEKAAKLKQYVSQPIVQQQFKISKFSGKNQTRIDTNLKPFVSAAQNILSNSSQANPADPKAQQHI